ncbi:NADH-quinone oxidoreductase subunit C [Acidiphilium multivorum]|nr:NADH-quinone oxidoreductase subunit C [Acidiphilium multivorum]
MPDDMMRSDPAQMPNDAPADRSTIEPFGRQVTKDGIETIWCDDEDLLAHMWYLKSDPTQNYRMLLDITAADERPRAHRPHPRCSDFTLIYHVLRYEDGKELRIKGA